MNAVEAHLIAAGGDPYAAARVSHFMRDDCPMLTPSENWLLATFEVDADAAHHNEIKAAIKAARHGGQGSDRWVPEGTYVSLKRKMRYDPDSKVDRLLQRVQGEWEPMMSDTPNEIEDHFDVIENAAGRVLVHGLGLGCIVASLSVMPHVEHIDVVEYDQEIIDLTGRYYADLPKVHIHHGSALTYEWPKDAAWDYVWHDIWARISRENLYPEEAEYGISYDMLFERFADRADQQGAWAYDLAHEQDLRAREEDDAADQLVAVWPTLTERERADIMIQAKFNVPGFPGQEAAEWREVATKAKALGEGADGFARVIEECDGFAKATPEIKQIEALMLLGHVGLDDLLG